MAVVPKNDKTSDKTAQKGAEVSQGIGKHNAKPGAAAETPSPAAADAADSLRADTEEAGARAVNPGTAPAAAAVEAKGHGSSNGSSSSGSKEAPDDPAAGAGEEEEEVIGCIALEQKSDTVAELRRMSVDAR